MRIFVQDQGLHNADIGQKDHLWMDTAEPLQGHKEAVLKLRRQK